MFNPSCHSLACEARLSERWLTPHRCFTENTQVFHRRQSLRKCNTKSLHREPRDSPGAGTGRQSNPWVTSVGSLGIRPLKCLLRFSAAAGRGNVMSTDVSRKITATESVHVRSAWVRFRRETFRTPRSNQWALQDSRESGSLSGQHSGTREKSLNCTELVNLRVVSQVWHLPPCSLPSEMKAL